MESERHLPLPYSAMIRGKKINLSPGEIHKVLNLRNKQLPNVASYHDRKNENDLRMNGILRDLCVPGAQWVMHDDGRPHFLRRTDLQPMAKGMVDQIIAEQIYKFSNKRGIRSKLPFPGVIQCLCNEAKASIPEDTMIPVEPPINAKVMERVRGERTATRQAALPDAMAEMQLQSNQRWDALQQRFDAA
ncbi:hypothetical protein PIB30_094317 [Stylosanthes scabra]|uniref:Uncharacterized protein n=1 Tax=Stylosanthes scabra TaxID=79078 RepID=A0ABU6QUQ3_9FABA|nr:hypothetical protein [Stylosanthes scabra]